MPTKKPRVNLVCSPELYAALDRCSKATGFGKSTLVVQMLEPAIPMLHAMAEASSKNRSSSHSDIHDVMAAVAEGILVAEGGISRSKQDYLRLREVLRGDKGPSVDDD